MTQQATSASNVKDS